MQDDKGQTPLHMLCSVQSFQDTSGAIRAYLDCCIEGKEAAFMTDHKRRTPFDCLPPLHLLAANPYVTGKMITIYLQLAPDVAVMQDDRGQTPLHILCSVKSFHNTSGAIRAYLSFCSEGKKAAFVTDHEGRTPFDYLCEKSYGDLIFLENKTFGGLLTWWYDHCLDTNM